MLQKIYSHSLVQLRVEQMGLMRPPEETITEHLAILNAIEKSDAELAVHELRNHLQKSKALIQENFKNEIP
jgi:DNA-binding GntR family transcriptional regulator